jgi:hypothetical protein
VDCPKQVETESKKEGNREMMFTGIAFAMVIGIGILGQRMQKSDDQDRTEINILQSRQDLRLIAYMLMAILVMLGLIADRLSH